MNLKYIRFKIQIFTVSLNKRLLIEEIDRVQNGHDHLATYMLEITDTPYQLTGKIHYQSMLSFQKGESIEEVNR